MSASRDWQVGFDSGRKQAKRELDRELMLRGALLRALLSEPVGSVAYQEAARRGRERFGYPVPSDPPLFTVSITEEAPR